MLFVFLFLVLILSITDPTNLRKYYYWISEKHDETFINLTNVFDFICSFFNYVGFDETKWLCASTTYTKNYNKTIIYINELILTLFTLLDIKYKKLNSMQKSSCNVFVGNLGE